MRGAIVLEDDPLPPPFGITTLKGGSSLVGWRSSSSNHLEVMRGGDDAWPSFLEWEATVDVALDSLPALRGPTRYH